MSAVQLQPVARRSDLVVGVVTPYPPSPSETFIRAHVDRLPARTVLVHGWRPSVGPRPVLAWPIRFAHKARRAITGTGLEREITAAYRKTFRRHRMNAVLAEYGPIGVVTAAACRALGLPLVVHFHGFDASVRTVLEEHADGYREMFRDAAAIIAPSRAMQDRLVALGAPSQKVHHIPYGIDCDEFGGAEPATAAPIMLAVGRFIEKKAPALTIQAFALVHRACPEARLRMVGDGPLLPGCRQLAEELLPPGTVTFLGTQPPKTIQEEMRRARVFLQHSVQAESGDSEGTPVAILEAGASGLPVVSTRHGGIPEVVVDGETGFLVDEKDVSGMAAAITRLVRDPELAARLGRSARRRIETLFTMERSLGDLWRVLLACIERSQFAVARD